MVHRFIHNVGNIPIGGVSRPLVITVPNGCLSRQASLNLYRTASNDLQVNSSL